MFVFLTFYYWLIVDGIVKNKYFKAHCVVSKSIEDIWVQLGRKALNGHPLPNEPDYEVRSIEDILIHPDYKDNTGGNAGLVHNDVALLKLNGKSMFDPVPLNDGSFELTNGKQISTIGWGSTTDVSGGSSPYLMRVEIGYIDKQTCQDSVPSFIEITDDILCVLPNIQGEGACVVCELVIGGRHINGTNGL